MSNLFTVFVFVALTSTVQGATVSPFDDIIRAASSGQWDKFQKLIHERFGSDSWKAVRPGGDVRDLKPQKGAHVYGESEYTFHSATNDNGRHSEISGGHKIINNDGKVEEYDFKPEHPAKILNADFKDVDFKDLLKDYKPVDFKAENFRQKNLKRVDFTLQPYSQTGTGSQSQPRYQKTNTDRIFLP